MVDRLEWRKKAKERARAKEAAGEQASAPAPFAQPPTPAPFDPALEYTGEDGVSRLLEVVDGHIVLTGPNDSVMRLYIDSKGRVRART